MIGLTLKHEGTIREEKEGKKETLHQYYYNKGSATILQIVQLIKHRRNNHLASKNNKL